MKTKPTPVENIPHTIPSSDIIAFRCLKKPTNSILSKISKGKETIKRTKPKTNSFFCKGCYGCINCRYIYFFLLNFGNSAYSIKRTPIVISNSIKLWSDSKAKGFLKNGLGLKSNKKKQKR